MSVALISTLQTSINNFRASTQPFCAAKCAGVCLF